MDGDRAVPDPRALLPLTHHRWAIPLLAACHRAPLGGQKHAGLMHALAISRDSLGRTLAAVIGQGWLGRHVGVQHALRPEYVLTESGRRIAPACARVLRALDAADVRDVGLNKWSLPVLLAARGVGGRRFIEIRGRLPRVTPRSLALTLVDLEREGLILRLSRGAQHLYAPAPRAGRVLAGARRLAALIGPRLAPDGTGPAGEEAAPWMTRACRAAG